MRPCLSAMTADVSSDDAVVDFLVAEGLLERRTPAPRGLAGDLAGLRDAIDSCVRAVAAGDAPDPGALARVDDWLVVAGTRPALRPGGDGLPELGERGTDSPRRALGMLALDAARLLGVPAERARLKVCAGCDEVFLDRSPAGGRRWCSMRRCGNRAKARRHRERAG